MFSRRGQGTSSIYSVKARDALASVVLPRVVDRESLDWVYFTADLASIDPELKLPLVKFEKIWYRPLILKYLADGHKAKAKKNIDRLHTVRCVVILTTYLSDTWSSRLHTSGVWSY